MSFWNMDIDSSSLKILAEVGGALGVVAGLFIGAASGFVGGLLKRGKDFGVNHADLLKQISRYAFYLGGLGLISIVGMEIGKGTGLLKIPVKELPEFNHLTLNAASMEYWSQFKGTLKFYNAPFTLTRDGHNVFKEDYLKASQFSKFEVLFFTGSTEREYKQFAKKWEGFDRALKALMHDPVLREGKFYERIKVQIFTSGRVPAQAFFLSQDSSDQTVCLAYFYPEEMVGTSASVERPEVSAGIYLTEQHKSFLNFNLDGFVTAWDRKWDSSGGKNIIVDLKQFLAGHEISTPAKRLLYSGKPLSLSE